MVSTTAQNVEGREFESRDLIISQLAYLVNFILIFSLNKPRCIGSLKKSTYVMAPCPLTGRILVHSTQSGPGSKKLKQRFFNDKC